MNHFLSLLRDRFWSLIAAGALLAALALGHIEFWPRSANLVKDIRALKDSRASIESLDEAHARMNELSSKRSRLIEELADISDRDDCEGCTAARLSELRQMADDAGLQLIGLRPSDAISDETLRTLPVELSLSGKYHTLGHFVNGVETASGVMRVQHIRAESTSSEGDLLISIRLDVLTFHQNLEDVR